MGAVELRMQDCSVPSTSPLVFVLFCFLLSTVSENKDIQNRRIVQLRQVRLWLRGSSGFPTQGRLPSHAQALGVRFLESLPIQGGGLSAPDVPCEPEKPRDGIGKKRKCWQEYQLLGFSQPFCTGYKEGFSFS